MKRFYLLNIAAILGVLSISLTVSASEVPSSEGFSWVILSDEEPEENSDDDRDKTTDSDSDKGTDTDNDDHNDNDNTKDNESDRNDNDIDLCIGMTFIDLLKGFVKVTTVSTFFQFIR